jgi:hypothetical protein
MSHDDNVPMTHHNGVMLHNVVMLHYYDVSEGWRRQNRKHGHNRGNKNQFAFHQSPLIREPTAQEL